MDTLGREVGRDLLLLSLAAGSADAVGYLSLGHVFTSNMTGNVVLLGVDIGQGDLGSAVRHLYVLVIFILGLSLGSWLSRDLPERQWSSLAFRLIGLEKILLLIFGVAWFFCADSNGGIVSYALLAPLAVAMGLQSAALFRLSAHGMGTTAVTGTITALSSGLINLLFATSDNATDKKTQILRTRFLFGVLLFYAGGAALSGFLIMRGAHWVGLVPIFASAFVSIGQRPKSDNPA